MRLPISGWRRRTILVVRSHSHKCEHTGQSAHGQTYHIIIATFEARHKTRRPFLYSIRTRFVERFSTRAIIANIPFRQSAEGDPGNLARPQGCARRDDAHPGNHTVGLAAECAEHAPGVSFVRRLAEHGGPKNHNGVRADYHRLRASPGDVGRLGLRQPTGDQLRSPRFRRFLDRRRNDLEWVSEQRKKFSATGGCGGEHERRRVHHELCTR